MLLSGRTALGLLFLGIGALLLRETYAVDVGAFAVPGEMGTMTYPRILLFGWIGLSILYLLNPGKPFNAHDLRASLRAFPKSSRPSPSISSCSLRWGFPSGRSSSCSSSSL